MFATLTIDQDYALIKMCKNAYQEAGVRFRGSFTHPQLGLCAHLEILNKKKFIFACIKIGVIPIIEESCHWKYDYSD